MICPKCEGYGEVIIGPGPGDDYAYGKCPKCKGRGTVYEPLPQRPLTDEERESLDKFAWKELDPELPPKMSLGKVAYEANVVWGEHHFRGIMSQPYRSQWPLMGEKAQNYWEQIASAVASYAIHGKSGGEVAMLLTGQAEEIKRLKEQVRVLTNQRRMDQ